jgi:glyoxylase-like metal-dependent hydrolase (beta-lactamase superfamily II)
MGKIDVDICVSEGDMIDLGGETLRAMEAPGHTKCCVSFYMPEKKLLLACETLGCPARPGLVLPCYIVGYEMSVNHIKRLLDMNIDMVLAPQYGLLKGEACRRFLQDALRSAVGLKDMILAEHGGAKV